MFALITNVKVRRVCWVLSTALLEVVQETPALQTSPYGVNGAGREGNLTECDYFNCYHMFEDPFSILL